jgi:hypothetical protein
LHKSLILNEFLLTPRQKCHAAGNSWSAMGLGNATQAHC